MATNKYMPRLHLEEVLFVCGKTVTKLHSPDGNITKAEEVRCLYSSHEEAHTKILEVSFPPPLPLLTERAG